MESPHSTTESEAHTRKDEAAPTKAQGISGRAIAFATFSVTCFSVSSTVIALRAQYDSFGICAAVALIVLTNLLCTYAVIFNIAQAPDFPNGGFKLNAKLKNLCWAQLVFAVVFLYLQILGC